MHMQVRLSFSRIRNSTRSNIHIVMKHASVRLIFVKLVSEIENFAY